ncbi:hypothetical protein PIL02S_00501 [Paenibacillus illinoisensis]|uniref:Uncharacterized protein n=1 Tax=Paenibacillus illinoisensis TaxID=59845 RepID=A0A2W0CFZ0_9BACL|nr:hypothetical protein PIL02S_00501 [Paenibacillus illinoisensis]
MISNVFTALIGAALYTILIFTERQTDGGMDNIFSTGLFYIFMISLPFFCLSIIITSLIVWIRDRLKNKLNTFSLMLFYLLVAIVFSVVFYFIHQTFFQTNVILGLTALLPLMIFGILYENYITKARERS